jgi:transcriptional regulator of acetoin/glycerol metabolism
MFPNMSLVRSDFEQGNHDLARMLDAPIYDSWQRCYANNLPMAGHIDYGFLSKDQFQDLFLFHKLLIDSARKHLDSLYNSLGGAGWSVLLTDKDCHVLDVRRSKNVCEPKIMEAFRQGAVLTEELIGTSAMSCALLSKRFVSVYGSEHYKTAHNNFHCAAIPIYDPTGEVCATVDITNEVDNRDPAAFYLLEACARNIQVELIMSLSDAIVIELQAGIGQFDSHNIVLAFSYEQVVIGANCTAQRFFDLDLKRKITHFHDLFDQPFSNLFDQGLLKDSAFTLNLTGGISLLAKVLSVPNSEKIRLLKHQDERSAGQAPVKKESENQPYFGDAKIDVALEHSLKAITRLPILILGESGVGKEVVAEYIHGNSPAHCGKLISVNCAAIPESLIESELFGYEAGSFTGASKNGKVGKIQQADGGTLFLDEIGDMPIAMQTRLLRVLETRKVVKLGGTASESVNFQLICATHKNLGEAIEIGEFRQDLFYRISGYELDIPPLRSRTDIVGLANKILIEETNGDRVFTPQTLTFIVNYDWPGNVRELRNAIVYADTLAEAGQPIEPTDLPASVYDKHTCFLKIKTENEPQTMRAVCDNKILETVARFDGNLTQAAKSLGIARSTIYRKINKLRLD